jgi:heme-degrading monooxygenase HmoA
MAFVLIEHQVGDFETFLTVYLDDADRRRRFGSLGGRVFRVDDDSGTVVVLLEWDTADRARDFALSLELHQATEWSGSGISTSRVLVFEGALDSPA